MTITITSSSCTGKCKGSTNGVEKCKASTNGVHIRSQRWNFKKYMVVESPKHPMTNSKDVGWRRYQTTPICYQVSYRRHKMLEFTPVDEPCLATFWGPLAPPGARVVDVRSLADNKAPFRILATADVLKFNCTAKIVERIKRIGTPCLILNETDVIKDMFM
ncbi:hypothetical protein C5167_029287 [Papaver somniferum]|nr:hypothetical protein C5167_029287 [Papaver somniferum]